MSHSVTTCSPNIIAQYSFVYYSAYLSMFDWLSTPVYNNTVELDSPDTWNIGM